jgi:hypothetical protein
MTSRASYKVLSSYKWLEEGEELEDTTSEGSTTIFD